MSNENIVILGGSQAGLGSAHYFLKHIAPELRKKGKHPHVYLVSESSHFFWRIGSPRALVDTKLMPDEKMYFPIADNFKQYDQSSFTFIQGTAKSMDPDARTVTITKLNGEKPQTLEYYALILATGTRTPTPLTSLWGDHTVTQKASAEMNAKLPKARSVVVSGGGPAGVEIAGEIGYALNGQAGWFSSRPSNPKAKVTLISGERKLLPMLSESRARQAEVFLNKVGVDVIYGRRVVTSPTSATDGKTTINLDNGEQLTADIFIPAHGVTPSTDYVPDHLKNERGYVKSNTKTLRVDDAGPRVYVLGDVGSYTRGGAMDMFDALPVLMTNVKRDLLAAVEKADAKPRGPDREYKPNLKATQIVPVGRAKGVGQLFNFPLPSLMVWFIKGRDYLASMAVEQVSGSKWNKEAGWTPKDG